MGETDERSIEAHQVNETEPDARKRRVLLGYLKDAVSKNKYHRSDCCPPTETRQLLAQIIPKDSSRNIVLSCTIDFISS